MVNTAEQLALKTSVTSRRLVSKIRDLRDGTNNMVDRQLLTPPKDLLTKNNSVRGYSPLMTSSLRYP
jgi:hypothetical protein